MANTVFCVGAAYDVGRGGVLAPTMIAMPEMASLRRGATHDAGATTAPLHAMITMIPASPRNPLNPLLKSADSSPNPLTVLLTPLVYYGRSGSPRRASLQIATRPGVKPQPMLHVDHARIRTIAIVEEQRTKNKKQTLMQDAPFVLCCFVLYSI